MIWLAHRFIHLLIVVWGVTTLVFIALRMTGDPAVMLLPGDPTMAEINLMRDKLGLNKPLWEQYVSFVVNAFQGRFGQSFLHGVDATGVVLERLPASALLAFTALAVASAFAIPMGILAAVNRGRLADVGVHRHLMVGQIRIHVARGPMSDERLSSTAMSTRRYAFRNYVMLPKRQPS